MTALARKTTFTGEVIYLHEWINKEIGKFNWRIIHAKRAYIHQSRELHEEHEAERLGYCVTCHRYNDEDL